MRYRITCAVERVHGEQTFLVEADSEEDAIAKHHDGLSEFEAEEVEVTTLGEPRAEEAP